MPPLPPPQLDEKGTILRLVIVEYKDSFFYWILIEISQLIASVLGDSSIKTEEILKLR